MQVDLLVKLLSNREDAGLERLLRHSLRLKQNDKRNIVNKTTRNLIIFTLATLGGGFLGMALDKVAPSPDPQQSLGALLWLITPLLTFILLRTFGGDGWNDFGFGPNLKSGWRWYLAALLIPVLVTLLTLGLGSVFGAFSLAGVESQGLSAFVSLMGVTLASVLVKNIFEEFAWRGYLTPRFEALKVHPFINYLLTGLIWAGWHVPYWLYFVDRATLQSHTVFSLPVFILAAFLMMPFHAFAYGELRQVSKSVWGPFLMHNVANAISLPLLTNGFVQLNGALGTIFSPGAEGIISALLMGLIGFGLYRYRMNNAPRIIQSDKNIPEMRVGS